MIVLNLYTKPSCNYGLEITCSGSFFWLIYFLSIQSAYGKIWKMFCGVYDTDSLKQFDSLKNDEILRKLKTFLLKIRIVF